MRILFFTLLSFAASNLFTQTVTEIIQLDTSSTRIDVIYRTPTEGYYFKKVAVYKSDTSQVAIQKTFTNYGQNGAYKVFYPSGKPMILTVFANNNIHGDWSWYSENGAIKIKGKYRNGVKYGYWTYKEQRFYGRYKNGLRHRKWLYKDLNGEKHRAFYNKGKLLSGSDFFKTTLLKTPLRKDANDSTRTIVIDDTYQAIISHLSNNYLFRKKFKYHYASTKKERSKLDQHFNYVDNYFKFRIAPLEVPFNSTPFLSKLNQRKTEQTAIDSILKIPFTTTEQKQNTALAEYATDKEAQVIAYCSKMENNLVKVELLKCDIIDGKIDHEKFYLNNSCKKFSILYYLKDSKIIDVVYEKPTN